MGLSGTHNDLFQRMSDRLASYQMTLDQSVYGSFARAREIFFDTIDETTRLPVIVIITLCLLSTMLAFLAAMLTCFMFGCISKDTCIAILKTIFAPCLWSVRFVSWLRSCCGSEDTSTSDMGTTSDTGDDGEESGGDIDGGAGGDDDLRHLRAAARWHCRRRRLDDRRWQDQTMSGLGRCRPWARGRGGGGGGDG